MKSALVLFAVLLASTSGACRAKKAPEEAAAAATGAGSIFVGEKELALTEASLEIYPGDAEHPGQWTFEAKVSDKGTCTPTGLVPLVGAKGVFSTSPRAAAELAGRTLTFIPDQDDDESDGTSVCAPSADSRVLSAANGPSFSVVSAGGTSAVVRFSGALNPEGPEGPLAEVVKVRGEARAVLSFAAAEEE